MATSSIFFVGRELIINNISNPLIYILAAPSIYCYAYLCKWNIDLIWVYWLLVESYEPEILLPTWYTAHKSFFTLVERELTILGAQFQQNATRKIIWSEYIWYQVIFFFKNKQCNHSIHSTFIWKTSLSSLPVIP